MTGINDSLLPGPSFALTHINLHVRKTARLRVSEEAPSMDTFTCHVSPTGRRYAYFGKDPRTCVVGYGQTVEEAFEGAAAAMFALVADPSCVRPVRTVPLSFIERDIEPALVRWLDLLLKSARDEKLVFSEFSIERDGALWRGCATGEPWPDAQRGAEDTAACMASVRQKADLWEARCVIRKGEFFRQRREAQH